ncbi:uncharacterized protein [Elaeis guineensis]|uniref:Uncharacterized protein LOC105057856 n=1 Tax=Elaeis guineensis var. tenera TaxID=51953 RepID=A0A6I9SFZ4_ELAGV|nr:uncharacterized protein LOC105057856 [Elaeis guineensis]
MGTEVLRPQDCLIRPGPALFPRRKPNPRAFRKPASKRLEGSPKLAKTAGGEDRKKGWAAECRTAAARNGGEWDLAAFGTGRLAPDMIPKQVRLRKAVDVYAGAGFANSPSPRALPLPRFWGRMPAPAIVVHDSATRDLRRLLRLE